MKVMKDLDSFNNEDEDHGSSLNYSHKTPEVLENPSNDERCWVRWDSRNSYNHTNDLLIDNIDDQNDYQSVEDDNLLLSHHGENDLFSENVKMHFLYLKLPVNKS